MMKIITLKKKQEIIINIENWRIDSYTKIIINNKYQLKYTDHLIYNCQNCHNESILKDKTKFDKFNTNEFLCNNCSREKTNEKLYGVKNVAQSKDAQEQRKKTCQEKYGVDHPLKNKKVQEKLQQTNLEKYNKKSYSQTEEAKRRKKETCLENYQVENPSQSIIIQNRKKETMQKNYGVDYFSQSEEIKEKIKKTNLEKYGSEYFLSSIEVRNQIKKTILEKQYNIIKEKFKDIIKPLFELKDYLGVRDNTVGIKYQWQCIKCNNIFNGELSHGFIPRCNKCFSIGGTSISEQELISWLKDLNLNVVEHDHTIIKPYELDTYLPDYNLAIEFNGLYYHSQISGQKNKDYHLNKTNLCKAQNIQLIHIFEDEWIYKKEIIQSVIKAKLNLYDQIIYARKCEIRKIEDINICRQFLDNNHLQGYVYSKYNYGLYYNDELVSMISFMSKQDYYELTRFCNKLNCKIIGAFSRLLKTFERLYLPLKIKTYADLRYSIGDVYLKNGFTLNHVSKPEYYYITKNYDLRLNRIQFQKNKLAKKLIIFDPILTEWMNMQLNGYDRIYGCGNLVFYKNKKE